jgi:hypothetical protein
MKVKVQDTDTLHHCSTVALTMILDLPGMVAPSTRDEQAYTVTPALTRGVHPREPLIVVVMP